MTNEGITEKPRAARSVARRQHLLDTARNLFVERGFHQTGMAQIASASGIAVGQIYRDFANKEAIVAAICEADISAWLEEENLKAAVASGDSQATRDWIERVIMDEPTCDERRLMCELLAEVGRNASIAELSENARMRVRSNLGTALAALAPQAATTDRDTLMDLLDSLAWGMAVFRELSPDSDHAALRQRVTAILRREMDLLF